MGLVVVGKLVVFVGVLLLAKRRDQTFKYSLRWLKRLPGMYVVLYCGIVL
jgi:hypothetical protein